MKLGVWVEREPMWDGNTPDPRDVFVGLVVEREPMWDGNQAADGKGVGTQHVEREPMWDGNIRFAWIPRAAFGLSENQCGMET